MPVAFRKEDEAVWLASEPIWTTRVGKGWKGTRFLGKGSFGVCGLWEFQPDYASGAHSDSFELSAFEPDIKQVVIKMSEYLPDEPSALGLKSGLDEGRFGALLALANSDHILRQFGTNMIGDSFEEIGDVVNIFLEYCPGGDLDQFLPRNEQEEANPKPLLQEPDLWALFYCMALGISVMDRGTETPQGPSPDWWDGTKRLLHGDLKMDNIILGFRNQDHSRIPIAKIADFGETVEVPLYAQQTPEYGAQFADRGAPQFKPPEEVMNMRFSPWEEEFKRSSVGLPRKGTCSNVWQIGAIMNCITLRKRLNFNPDPLTDPDLSLPFQKETRPEASMNLRNFYNHSIGLSHPNITRQYSENLLSLIQECMLRPSLLRPGAPALVERTRNGLNAALRATKELRALPENFERIPMVGPERPEPPVAWIIDHQRFEDGMFRVPSQDRRRSSVFSLGGLRSLLPGSPTSRSGTSSPSRRSSEAPSPNSTVYWSGDEWEAFIKSPERGGSASPVPPTSPTRANRVLARGNSLLRRAMGRNRQPDPNLRGP